MASYSVASGNPRLPPPPPPLSFSMKSSSVSYEDMKRILKESGIFEPDTIKTDDAERTVCIFTKDSITYVLKMGNRDTRGDTTKYALLQDEANIYEDLKKLPEENSRYFPRIYTSGDVDGKFYYILMEYIEGKTLFDYVNGAQTSNTSNSYKEVLTILLNLTQALNALWSGGIVHNDLSVENVMVQEDLNVKLIDFEESSKDIRIQSNTIGSIKEGIGYLYLVTTTLKTVKDHTKYADLLEKITSEVKECKDPKCLTVYANCIDHIKAAMLSASASGGKRKKSRRRNRNKKSKTRRH
jgi:serine/threonine protein kinase